MRRNLVILAFCAAAFLALAPPVRAQEAQPGDACTTAEEFIRVGGPENPGSGHFMLCDGATWQPVLNYSSANRWVMFGSAGLAAAPLHVWGEAIIGSQGLACAATAEGALRYTSASDLWEYCDGAAWQSLGSGAGGTLDGLTDTTISSPSNGQLLQWNGSAWVNATFGSASGFPEKSAITCEAATEGDIAKEASPNGETQFYCDGIKWRALREFQVSNTSATEPSDYVRVFVTSAGYIANQVGGVSGADDKCNALAAAEGLPGTYMAWIADNTDGSAPASRFDIVGTSKEFRLVDGTTVVANNWTDLTDATLDNDINKTESGATPGGPFMWTNVTTSGTREGTDSCSNWSTTSGIAAYGRNDSASTSWTDSSTAGCSSGMRLYCFQQTDTDGKTARLNTQIGNDQGSCGALKLGRLRYDEGSDAWEYCDGAAWQSLGGGAGLWTDNTTHISYQSAHIINTSQALPAIFDDDGTRMFFYPDKAAYRGGEISTSSAGDSWADANIGARSFAFGLDTKASNSNSVALGNKTVASGNDSLAIGESSVAGGSNSFAGGFDSSTSNVNAFAFGSGAQANGLRSVAMGGNAIASGDDSVALGRDVAATGGNAMGIGLGDVSGADPQVSGNYSLGIFMGNQSGVNVSASNVMAIMGGKVGIGETTPNVELDVAGDIEYTGTLTAVSDIRMKYNIEPLDSPLAKLTSLHGLSYDKKSNNKSSVTEYGFAAQEVQEVFPELVRTAPDEIGTLSVNYIGLIAPMVEAMKEQQAQISALERQNKELLRRLEALEAGGGE